MGSMKRKQANLARPSAIAVCIHSVGHAKRSPVVRCCAGALYGVCAVSRFRRWRIGLRGWYDCRFIVLRSSATCMKTCGARCECSSFHADPPTSPRTPPAAVKPPQSTLPPRPDLRQPLPPARHRSAPRSSHHHPCPARPPTHRPLPNRAHPPPTLRQSRFARAYSAVFFHRL